MAPLTLTALVFERPHLAVLGNAALLSAALLQPALDSATAPRRVAALAAAVECLASDVSSLQQDMAFWAGRGARVRRRGRVLGPALDVLEGGPWEWASMIADARASGRVEWGTLHTLYTSPPQRIAVLRRALAVVAPLLGALVREAAAVHAENGWWERAVLAANAAEATLRAGGGVEARAKQVPSTHTLSSTVAAVRELVREQTSRGARRPAWQCTWLRVAAAGAAACFAARYVAANSSSIHVWALESARSLRTFLVEHVSEPARLIRDEVFLGKRLRVANDSALNDARESLGAMLTNFYRKISASGLQASLSGDLRSVDLAALARAHDMRPASERFVAEVGKPVAGLMSGDLLEVVLLQVAFIKSELLSALSAMDAILADNRVNFAVAATMPVFLIMFTVSSSLSMMWTALTAPNDSTDASIELATSARALARAFDSVRPIARPKSEPFGDISDDDLGHVCGNARRFIDTLFTHNRVMRVGDIDLCVEDVMDALSSEIISLRDRRRVVDRLVSFKKYSVVNSRGFIY
jgi:hypothetical protein